MPANDLKALVVAGESDNAVALLDAAREAVAISDLDHVVCEIRHFTA